jgi:hypothetical protein
MGPSSMPMHLGRDSNALEAAPKGSTASSKGSQLASTASCGSASPCWGPQTFSPSNSSLAQHSRSMNKPWCTSAASTKSSSSVTVGFVGYQFVPVVQCALQPLYLHWVSPHLQKHQQVARQCCVAPSKLACTQQLETSVKCSHAARYQPARKGVLHISHMGEPGTELAVGRLCGTAVCQL